MFTGDPAVAGDTSELIGRIGAAELLSMNLATLPIDEMILRLLAHTKHVREIQIVNGLRPGTITKALQGQPVGTVVHADGHPDGGSR